MVPPLFPAGGRSLAAVALKALAALAVGGAWGMLGHGLLAGPHDARVYDDLDAGGRFALNVTVIWPFLLTSVVITALVVVALLPRRWPVVALSVAATVAFAAAVLALGSDVLRAAQPLLERDARAALLLASLSWPAIAAARLLRAGGRQSAEAAP